MRLGELLDDLSIHMHIDKSSSSYPCLRRSIIYIYIYNIYILHQNCIITLNPRIPPTRNPKNGCGPVTHDSSEYFTLYILTKHNPAFLKSQGGI